MFRLIGSFHFETSPKGRFCPSGYIIHIGFIPFTDFTFFNQIPYPSVIQGEGPLLISDLCANVSQVPGIHAVSTEHTDREHRAYGS